MENEKEIEMKSFENSGVAVLEPAADKAPATSLEEALVFDPVKTPERTNATLARVGEVLSVVLGDPEYAAEVFEKAKTAAGEFEPFDGLSKSAAKNVAYVLTGLLSGKDCAKAAEMFNQSELSTDEVVALHRKYKIPVSHLEDDLLPVKGEGANIIDSKGKTYVDLDSNYSATNLGNANPELALGLFNQANLLVSQKEDRIQVARARFLKEIGGMLPAGLTQFYWQNSGGEAVDKSLKIAKAYTGQTGVVAFEGGFHGRTHGAVAVTHNIAYRKPFGLDKVDWVNFAQYNNLESVEKFLASGKAKIVILELVQGEESGIRPATPEFAKGLRALCDKYSAVLIADEVQTGFGRVSSGEGKYFACQVYGIVPDIIVIGKSFGGGYPVTAVVTNSKIASAMKPGYDGSTFGGTPMAMTAALIATRQMKALNLPKLVAERSKQFKDGIEGLKSPLVKGHRIMGLMIGIDLPSAAHVHKAQELLKEYGVHSSLSSGAAIRWMPPLIITKEEAAHVLNAFAKALDKIASE
jgi:acetylornithine/succinyldiaminopimelate/putrescine aminotransferase